MKQPSFASIANDNKKKKTKKGIFLEEMERVMPWDKLLAPILEVFPKGENGRRPFPATTTTEILRKRLTREEFTCKVFTTISTGSRRVTIPTTLPM